MQNIKTIAGTFTIGTYEIPKQYVCAKTPTITQKNDICEIVTYDQQITVNGHNYAPVLHQNCMQPEQITLYPLVIRQEHATLTVSDRYHTGHWKSGDDTQISTGVQSLCTGDVCHVPIAEGVSTFYILFQPKCNRRFIFTWSVIYFTVFYANSMTYYLKNLKCQLQVFILQQFLIFLPSLILFPVINRKPLPSTGFPVNSNR